MSPLASAPQLIEGDQFGAEDIVRGDVLESLAGQQLGETTARIVGYVHIRVAMGHHKAIGDLGDPP